MKRTTLLAALAATTGCSSVARVPELDPLPTQVVHYDDLDITSASGALTLYGRIEQAVLRVCEPARLQVVLHDRAAACVRRAVADAATGIDAPMLAAIHARYGRLVPEA